MLHIICALKPESRPLQEYFELQPLPGAASIYHNPEARLTLTLSGIGKSATAAAVARTRDHFRAGRSHAWLNLGIAGHASLPLGQAVVINKVTDAASGKSWYPSVVFTTTLPARDLLTLDQPDNDYRDELFDMECAGFFQAATECATLELVQALKIISDNPDQPMDSINPDLVIRLVTQNLPVIEEVIEQLLDLSKLQQLLNDPGPDYHALIRRRHFTVTQQHQLQSLLRKWRVLHPADTGLAERLAGMKTAAEILHFLKDELEKSPISFSNIQESV